MSWGIRFAGPPNAVITVVNKDTNIPEGLKASISLIAAGLQLGPGEVVLVTTQGHCDTYGGGGGEFKVERVTLVELTPAAPQVVPVATPGAEPGPAGPS